MIKYYKYLLILFVFLLNGCEEDKVNSTETDNTQVQENSDKVLEGKLELGAIANAYIDFKLLNGTVLYSTSSDNNGKFQINITRLEKELSSNGYTRNTPFYIYGENGVDIDSNDDGLIDDEPINLDGYVKGIVTINQLNNMKFISINLLSTYIADSVVQEGYEDISFIDAKSKILINNYNFKDINNDGKIDMYDIYSYDMIKNNEPLESTLRIEYLTSLHSGNDKSKEITSKLNQKFDSNIIFETIKTDKNNANLQLHTTNNLIVKVKKECTLSLNDESLFMNNEDTIYLDKDCTIVYNSCINENNCSQNNNILSYDVKSQVILPYKPYTLEGNGKKLMETILISRDGLIIDNIKLKEELVSSLKDAKSKGFSVEEQADLLCEIYHNYNLDCPR